MYMCGVCNEEFETPKVILDDPSPAGVSLPSGAYRYDACPYCGSEEVEEAKVCPSCGEHHIGEGVLCDDCAQELAGLLNRIRSEFGLTKDDFEDEVARHFGW